MSLVRRPSPALIGLAAFASGIVLGLLASGMVVIAASVAAVIISVAEPRLRLVGWIVAAGASSGWLANVRDARGCQSRLDNGRFEGIVAVVEPAPLDGPGAARLVRAGCSGTVPIRHDLPDTLWAGDRWRVEGTYFARRDRFGLAHGTLILSKGTKLPSAPGIIDGLRNFLLRSIGTLYGLRSGLIRALILGTPGTLDQKIRDVFARSGLIHLLSISGFHVGVVWAWTVMLLGAIGVRRVSVIAAVTVGLYIGFIGAPAPAVRAGILAALTAIERARQRHPAPGPLFAVVAMMVLILDPTAVVDLGAWLSVGALWGATAATAWAERIGARSNLWRTVAGSVGSTVGTAPIAGLALGNVSLAGVALNIVAIPLAAVAVPAVITSVAVNLVWQGLARSLAAGGGLVLAFIEWLATAGASVGIAAWQFEPGVIPALVASLVAVAVIWIVGTGHTLKEAGRRLGWIVALVGLGDLVSWPGASRGHAGHQLTLHFLDVGQGDAALLETRQGHWILVDAGPASDRADAGWRVIIPFLRRHDVRRIEAVVLSHAHRDHYGGIRSVLGAIEVGAVVEPGVAVPDPEYLELLDLIGSRGIPWRTLCRGDRIMVDSVLLEVVHPDTAAADWGLDLNESSVVIRMSSGAFTALFAGDAGLVAESTFPAMGAVDVLKVGHHGSRGASGRPWLDAIRPRVGVVSVGRNRYGHPSPEALGRLDASGVAVWRTDREGTIRVDVDATVMTVSGKKTEHQYSIE